MTITGGSALPKDDIERMMREAEAHAEEDKQRREEVETRNSAESLVYTTEKFLGENGDKLPAEGKGDVESLLGELKAVLAGSDVAAIRAKADELARKSSEVGAAMYAQTDPTGAAGAAGAGTAGAPDDEGVVDAEVVEGDVEDGKAGDGK